MTFRKTCCSPPRLPALMPVRAFAQTRLRSCADADHRRPRIRGHHCLHRLRTPTAQCRARAHPRTAAPAGPGQRPRPVHRWRAARSRPLQPGQEDVVATLKASGQFTTLLKALTATGLTPVLKTTPASPCSRRPTPRSPRCRPTSSTAEGCSRRTCPEACKKALAYHVVNTKVAAAEAKGHRPRKVATVSWRQDLKVDGATSDGPSVKVNDATVSLQAGRAASNGTIYRHRQGAHAGLHPADAACRGGGLRLPTESTTEKSTTTTKKTKTTRRKK